MVGGMKVFWKYLRNNTANYFHHTVLPWVSTSCLFFLHFLSHCNIFLLLWLFFAIGSIHQEAQAVKFSCSCTSSFTDCSCILLISSSIVSCSSGLLWIQLSSNVFQVQLLAVLPDISGYNCFLHFFQFQRFIYFGVLSVY
jgi:hypothetical protein